MLSRLDNVLAIDESAHVSGCLMRTDCDKLLTHGIEVETMAVKCLLERPDVVDLHKSTNWVSTAAALSEQEPPRAGSCEQRNVSREPSDASCEMGEVRHAQGAKSPQRGTVKDEKIPPTHLRGSHR